MNRTYQRVIRDCASVPRTRGDEPGPRAHFPVFVFPARAGIAVARVAICEERVPRTRGDEPREGECSRPRPWCSPHARG